jgi:outer membrane protein
MTRPGFLKTSTDNTRLGGLLAGMVLALCCVPSAAAAQSTMSPTRIGWLNMQQILRDTPGYALAESTFTREVRGFQQDLEKQRVQFDSMVSDYQKRATLLNSTAKQAKEAQLRDLTTQLQQKTNDLQGRAQRRQRELVGPIEERVRSVIEGLRAERSIAVILDAASPGSGIVAADPSLDLTAAVVSRLKTPPPSAPR